MVYFVNNYCTAGKVNPAGRNLAHLVLSKPMFCCWDNHYGDNEMIGLYICWRARILLAS